MSIYDTLSGAALFLASRRQAAHAKGREDEEKLWRYVRALGEFVHVTGQVYRFEDFLEAATPRERGHINSRLSTHKGTWAQLGAQLLLEALGEASEPEPKQHLTVLLALLNFVVDTDQLEDVEDFFIHQLEYAPVVIAHFSSLGEAEAWLKGTVEPPSPARILVGDEHYQFWYMREDNTRGMYRDYVIEPILESLASSGISAQTPSFATRVEAESWLREHPATPYAFLSIAGEYYFAVHYWRLKRHSLHHVASSLKAWEEHKRAVELEAALEAATQPDGASE